MRIKLETVGSAPPRTRRGKTFLDARYLTGRSVWGTRALVVVVMGVLNPASWVVGAWWMWGLRWRMWRWRMVVPAMVVALAGMFAVVTWSTPDRLLPAVQVITSLTGGGDLPGALADLHVLGLVVSAWTVGTVVGAWWSFLDWHRTPPWKDRPRPKSMWARRRQRVLTRAMASGEGDVPGVVTFGVDTTTGQAVDLPWSDTEGHVLVVGSPGTGKTETSLRVVRAAIRDGLPTFVVDMKASPKMIDRIATWCARWDRPLYVFSAEGPSTYDPFLHGDFNRKRDLLMATSAWTEEHYRGKAADYLLTVFYVLELSGVTHGMSWLHTVTELLNPNILARKVAELPAGDPRTIEARKRAAVVIDEITADPRALSGLGPRVRALTDTILGRWVQPGQPAIDVTEVWDQGGVVLWSLPTLAYPDAAAAFGGLVVQDLKTLAGTLQERGNTQPGLVFVDEFATLGAHNVAAALAMGRESKLRWMLATQDLGDLEVGDDGKAFVQKVLTDTNIKVLHSVGDPVTATRLAELAGQRWNAVERTAVNQQATALDFGANTAQGHGFVDHVLAPVIEPSDVLSQGFAEESTFTLINKPGSYVVTGAHTVIDGSGYTGTPNVPLHLPGSRPVPGAPVVAATPGAPVAVASATDDGWWD